MRALAPLLLSVAVTGAFSLASVSPGPVGSAALVMHKRHEITRLRAHFDSVDHELRSHSLAALSPRQLAARSTLIRWLREYRSEGAFPLNDQYPDRTTPILRDRRGVYCAMAYLVTRSGRGDIIARLALGQNTARITVLAADSSLVRWLDSVGLSVSEAARIQPSYPPPPGTVYARNAVTAGFALTSVLVGGASIATTALNVAKPSKTAGWIGLLAGTGTLIAGLDHLDGLHATHQVAVVDVVVGGVAVVAGLRGVFHRGGGGVAHDRASDHAKLGELALLPVLAPAKQPQIGLVLRATF